MEPGPSLPGWAPFLIETLRPATGFVQLTDADDGLQPAHIEALRGPLPALEQDAPDRYALVLALLRTARTS